MEEGGEKREDMTKKVTEENVQEEEKIEEVAVMTESSSRNDEVYIVDGISCLKYTSQIFII